MALDICVESYGMMVHALDTGFVSHLSNLGFRADRRQRPQTEVQDPCPVKQHADELPFRQAKSLWLVDVCGCSYDQAAAEMRIDRADLAASVAAGRTSIRDGIEA
jgi:predicted DNA-binding protein (UPF0251 family)